MLLITFHLSHIAFYVKLGKAFSDSVIIEHTAAAHVGDGTASWWLGWGRVLLFTTLLSVLFFILVWRLFDLTMIEGHHYRALADGNRTRELIRHAPRGLLLDRKGKPLVTNIPSYRLLRPCDKNQHEDCITQISQDQGNALTKKGLPPGTFLEVDYERQYTYPVATSHVVGYAGELTEGELADAYYKLHDYRRGDRVGRTAAEAVFEDRLRGRDGKELVEVDAQGVILRTLGRDKELPGENITLSIDADLQQAVYEDFPKSAKGAVIVSKPGTGEILALYSSPSFNLDAFSKGLSEEAYDALVNDPDRPLFDRAIGGTYPPGSTYKIVTAIAALEEGAVRGPTIIDDVGVLKIGPFSFPNWYFKQYGKTEGPVDIVKAIQRSNDIYFYKAGEWLGISKLVSWSRKMGLGKPFGIELAGEAGGIMPDPQWKAQLFSSAKDKELQNDQWYLGDTYHVGIGQGYLLVTPLQVNTWTNIVASGGKQCKPTIKKASPYVTGKDNCKDLGLKKETIDLITEGMKRACETGGTGYPLFNFAMKDLGGKLTPIANVSTPSGALTQIPVACKTGTAEYGDPDNNTHAWFTAFAPLRSIDSGNQSIKQDQNIITGDPEISVTVLVEGGGEGSTIAAPIAKKIFETWFSR
ncbi:hypothetical protein A2Z00_01820 [Candidatus Gottesmanbacteria bacterium RBG_13_45_10]|uniref:Beta-lactamase n=1 Tax=Candidatus Gottesmanbacteria bacterium RBG_13_45_10 TaxID=1798370 RepID=A0A1F5ZGZ3_9BACT|nr:MAG: hypothetical protein A2Z00_01820 [Candidatus Gottesmanbacteria bacterium RBG_13_45_10]